MAKRLTTRGIRSKVKLGWTIEDCMHEYGFSTEEEFLTKLQKLYGKDTSTWETVYSDLKKNESKKENKKKRAITDNETAEPTIPNSNQNEESVEPVKTELEIALEKKAAVTKTISILSSEMEVLYSQRDETASDLTKVNTALEELLVKVAHQQKVASEIMRKMKENEGLLSKKTCELEAAKAEEARIDEQIQKLQIIRIAFFVPSEVNNGEYQYVAKDISVDNMDIQNRMVKLLFTEEIGILLNSYAVEQVKALAKILLIVDKVNTEHPNKTVELVFETASDVTEILKLLDMKVKVI